MGFVPLFWLIAHTPLRDVYPLFFNDPMKARVILSKLNIIVKSKNEAFQLSEKGSGS